MRYEWDKAKAESNIKKHGISFELAAEVFGDPSHISFASRAPALEERWLAIGMVEGFVLVVVHTYRERNGELVIRIISARRADRKERKLYEESTN